MKHYTVVAAVIKSGEKFLCVQRNSGKYDYISFKYEFPGGKVEEGESNQQALVREIQEELEMDIEVEEDFLTVDHQYPDFKLTMHSFICSTSSEVPHLKEHIAYKWLRSHELEQLDWAAADIPIVEKLMK